MSVHHPKIRLFVEPQLHAGAVVALTPEQTHYLATVMRADAGTKLALFNGRDGEWVANFLPESKKRASAAVESQRRAQVATPDVWFMFAPIKSARIDFMAEKAAELGASKLIPVMTARTNASRVNTERLQAHAKEAAEQCERLDVPPVEEPLNFAQAITTFPENRVLVYGDESGKGEAPDVLFTQLSDVNEWAVLVGPEGGFAPEEFAALRAMKNARAISLGPRVLRADTAGLAALTCVMAWRGDWAQKPRFEG